MIIVIAAGHSGLYIQDQQFIMHEGILKLLAQGFTLVTPTGRLSRHLRSQFADLQVGHGHSAWETPSILPWDGWLQHLWEEYTAANAVDRLLLSPYQQQLVWQQIITESRYARKLLNIRPVASKALAAWELCREWKIRVPSGNHHLNEDTSAFQNWAGEYVARCKSRGLVDEQGLADELAEVIHNGSLKFGKKIALIGFDILTPQQYFLINVLKTSGSKVHELPAENRTRKVFTRGSSDSIEEIRYAANWSRERLEQDLAASIGIIVPNLRTLRSQVENIFDDVLLPSALIISPGTIRRPYSVSQGRSLNNYPVTDTALQILALGKNPLSVVDIGNLLKSPFVLDAHEEMASRAKLDARLREFGEQKIDINTFLYLGNRIADLQDRPATFLSCCHQWREIFRNTPGSQRVRQWASTFSGLLDVFKWPGNRGLTGEEYQTVEAWQEALGHFAALDLVAGSLHYSEALAYLHQILSSFRFQPETPEAPIQVLGMAGAAGMQFDYLWITGMHEEAWPAPAVPNPFIPVSLQRMARVPNATAEASLDHAQLMTERLVDSAREVVLSYPLNDRERILRPSPLIKPYLDNGNELAVTARTPLSMRQQAAQQTEVFEDYRAPPIPAGETAGGGTDIFKDQAACPFRAFSRHRLHARGLRRTDIGLDAMVRGQLVHEVMQLLWQGLGGQKTLLLKDEAALTTSIDTVIETVLSRYQKRRPRTFTGRFMQIEKQRLNGLAREGFAIERTRQPFTVVACEQEKEFFFQGIKVHTRIDRIDKLADDRHVILDYKTGTVSLKSWFDERPDEPQLPLYAVTSELKIAALVFAHIKQGETAYIGLSDGEDIFPQTKTINDKRYTKLFSGWESLFKQWQVILERLAKAFCDGDARVDPKDINTCRYCDLHCFCRIESKSPAITEVSMQETGFFKQATGIREE